MNLDAFDYHLPPERIAQNPVRRGQTRLLVLPDRENSLEHTRVSRLADWLRSGDCLVVNDSKVIPARLWARKTVTNGAVEFFLHRELRPGIWEALSRPYRRLRPGLDLKIGRHPVRVASCLGEGRVALSFGSAQAASRIIRQHGLAPLPPYIRRTYRTPTRAAKQDQSRYQTIFARTAGSVAAPTAGLHFTRGLLARLKTKGVGIVPITLHVGWGTFMPLKPEHFTRGRLHPERYRVSANAARRLARCRKEGGRVIACGTTAARTLETVTDARGIIRPGEGETDLFIRSGHAWKGVDGLLTNFHLPRSSLFMLVCSFAGHRRMRAAYREAIRQDYRFYSYGDAMLTLRAVRPANKN